MKMLLYEVHMIEQIVYDSPLKLESDLRYCFENGIHVNFDNLEEVINVLIILSRCKWVILSTNQ